MTKFESKIKSINKPAQEIFEFLSDFNNFSSFIQNDSIQDWENDTESCSFSVKTAGKVSMKIIEKEEYKTLKYQGSLSMVPNFNFWIQIKEVAVDDTKIKLTLGADLNPMIKMAVSKPAKEGIDMVATKIADYLNAK